MVRKSITIRRGVAAGIVLALTLPGISLANSNAKKKAFEECIKANVTAEKQKGTPSAQGLLDTCSTEYGEFLATLPDGVTHDIEHKIKDEIVKMLD